MWLPRQLADLLWQHWGRTEADSAAGLVSWRLAVLPGDGLQLGTRVMRYVLGAYSLDTESGEPRHAGASVPLEPKVYQMLVYLIEQRHRTVL